MNLYTNTTQDCAQWIKDRSRLAPVAVFFGYWTGQLRCLRLTRFTERVINAHPRTFLGVYTPECDVSEVQADLEVAFVERWSEAA